MEDRLRQLFSRRQKRRIVDSGRLPAAVLVPIYRKNGQYHVLLTLRTDTVSLHKGQISFPGGTYQAGDGSLLNTALRESAEEIGLRPEDADVLGEMDDEISVTTNFIIAPFVAVIPWPYSFKLCEAETAEIIEAPIPELQSQGYHKQSIKTPDGTTIASYAYHYQGSVIWGATARILNRFLAMFARAERLRPSGHSPS